MDVYALMKSRVDQKLHVYRKQQDANARLQLIKDVYLQKMIKSGDAFRRGQNNLNHVNDRMHDTSGHSLEAVPCYATDEHLHNCEHYKCGIGVNEKRFMKWKYEEMANRRHIDMQSRGKFDIQEDKSQSEKSTQRVSEQRCKSAPVGCKRTPDPFKSLRRTPVWNPDSRSESIQAWANLQHQKYVEKVLDGSNFKNKRASAEPKPKPITGSDEKSRRSKSAPQRARIKDETSGEDQAIVRVRTANRELQVETPQNERLRRSPVITHSRRNKSALLKTIIDLTTSPKPTRRISQDNKPSKPKPCEAPEFCLLSKQDFELVKTKPKMKKVNDDESVAEPDNRNYVPRWRRELLIEAPPHLHELISSQTPCTMPKWERRRLLRVMMKENRERLRQTRISESQGDLNEESSASNQDA